jgi:hypothetical protein
VGAAGQDEGVSVCDHTARWLSLHGVVNARAVIPGVLLRADNLQSLTPDDVRHRVEEALEVVAQGRPPARTHRWPRPTWSGCAGA